MSDEVKNRPQLRVRLIREILSEAISIRMDQSLWEFFRWTTVLLLSRDARLRWDTLYVIRRAAFTDPESVPRDSNSGSQ
jgi:hypothetical protein